MASTPSPVCDFSRSFIRWRIDTERKKAVTSSHGLTTTLNDVRMPIESHLTLKRGGRTERFGLGASCKSERVFVERDIWTVPNADMLAVAGSDPAQFMIVSRYDRTNKGVMLHPPSLGEKPDRQAVDPAEAFESMSLDLRFQTARKLESIEEVLEVFRGEGQVVSRTVYSADGFEVTVEYPVKTVNYSARHRYYQVDTGPVLFFGEPTGPKPIERLHLAYVAHLGRDWAEFLVSRPTRLDNFPVSVHHYSDSRHVQSDNSLWLM